MSDEERGAVDAPKPMSEEDSAAIGEAAAAELGVGESEDDQPAEEAEWDVGAPEPYGAYESTMVESEDETYEEWSEPELSEADRALLAERSARLKAERSLEWLQSQELARRRQHWVKSSAKHRPYLQPEDLEQVAKSTTSRREFERRSKALNEQVGKVAAPIIEKQLAEERAKLRAEAARSWGPPTSGPGVPSEATKIAGDVEKAREAGDLEGAIRGHMESIFGKGS